jgi:thiol-disulfide isomerase/thioredoxin
MPFRPALSAIALVAAAVFVPAMAAPLPPPVVSAEPVVAAPHPYDEDADAHAQVEAALAEAKRTGKHVLLEFGGNWCPDCRVLAGITARPEVKPWLDANYAEVSIDVGHFTKNLDIAQRYGLKLAAIPAVLVLSPDGAVQNLDNALALGDARTMVPQDVVATLARWCSPATVTN